MSTFFPLQNIVLMVFIYIGKTLDLKLLLLQTVRILIGYA